MDDLKPFHDLYFVDRNIFFFTFLFFPQICLVWEKILFSLRVLIFPQRLPFNFGVLKSKSAQLIPPALSLFQNNLDFSLFCQLNNNLKVPLPINVFIPAIQYLLPELPKRIVTRPSASLHVKLIEMTYCCSFYDNHIMMLMLSKIYKLLFQLC